MSGRPPPPAHRRAALALVSLVVVALALGAAAPAAAAAPGVTDEPLNETTTDTGATFTPTTDDATSTVGTTDDTASTVEDTGSTTDSTVETTTETTASTLDTVNGTAATLSSELETTAELRLAESGVTDLPTTLDASTEPLPDGLSTSGEGSVDEAGTDEAVDRPTAADGAAAATDPSRSGQFVQSPIAPTDANAPLSPLVTGVTALGGVLVGSVVLRHGLDVASTPGQLRIGIVRLISDAGAARLHARWQDGWRWLGGLFGYQRYDDSDPLEHETRVALLEAIEDAKAAYLTRIAREANVPLSTARYHLKVLERESVVRSVKLRGKRLYVSAGEQPSALEAALADDAAAAVLEALATHGPDTVSGLAAVLGRDVSTITHHLQALESAGLVERERDGRAVMNRLAPTVRETMAIGDGPSPATARSD